MRYLTLEDLKNKYMQMNSKTILPFGISEPFSWRGSYEEVAFAIVEDISVEDCLEHIDQALNNTFEGWKGGEFEYDLFTEVHFEEYAGGYSDGLYSKRKAVDVEEHSGGNPSPELELFTRMYR